MTEAEALVLVTDAALDWAQELVDYIAPASEEYLDTESAKNQRQSAADIREAVNLMRSKNA